MAAGRPCVAPASFIRTRPGFYSSLCYCVRACGCPLEAERGPGPLVTPFPRAGAPIPSSFSRDRRGSGDLQEFPSRLASKTMNTKDIRRIRALHAKLGSDNETEANAARQKILEILKRHN